MNKLWLFGRNMEKWDVNVWWINIKCNNDEVFFMEYEYNEIDEKAIDVNLLPVLLNCKMCKQQTCDLLLINLLDLADQHYRETYD